MPPAAVTVKGTALSFRVAAAERKTHAKWGFTDVQQCFGAAGLVLGTALVLNVRTLGSMRSLRKLTLRGERSWRR